MGKESEKKEEKACAGRREEKEVERRGWTKGAATAAAVQSMQMNSSQKP